MMGVRCSLFVTLPCDLVCKTFVGHSRLAQPLRERLPLCLDLPCSRQQQVRGENYHPSKVLYEQSVHEIYIVNWIVGINLKGISLLIALITDFFSHLQYVDSLGQG